MARPWLVIVTGEPGSGKTALGTQLAQTLRLPFVSRDLTRGGLLATTGLWTGQLKNPPPREDAVEAFVQIVETTARLGVSAVLEFVVLPDRAAAFERIHAAGNCLVIRLQCADAPARARRRDLADPLLNRPAVLQALGHESVDGFLTATSEQGNIVRSEMQTEFALPLLTVRTDDGYEPAFDEIVAWVVSQTQR